MKSYIRHSVRLAGIPPLPVSLSAATPCSAPEGDHLGRLVNFSWSFPHSERLVSGEELSEGGVGRDVVFIYEETCCAAPCHMASEHPAVWWWLAGRGVGCSPGRRELVRRRTQVSKC